MKYGFGLWFMKYGLGFMFHATVSVPCICWFRLTRFQSALYFQLEIAAFAISTDENLIIYKIFKLLFKNYVHFCFVFEPIGSVHLFNERSFTLYYLIYYPFMIIVNPHLRVNQYIYADLI